LSPRGNVFAGGGYAENFQKEAGAGFDGIGRRCECKMGWNSKLKNETVYGSEEHFGNL